MKAKITITGRIKRPKVGDSYCNWGLSNKSGFSCEQIKRVHKTYIVAGSNMISMRAYIYHTLMNKQIKRVEVKEIK